MKKSSSAGYRKISQNSLQGLEQNGIYYLELLNNSKLNVTAKDKKIGDIPLVPGIPFKLEGHPEYPFDISFKFLFDAEGETNYITATYLKAHGNAEK